MRISQKGKDLKSSAYYFHVNTKISIDFQICISVPLIKNLTQGWMQSEPFIPESGNFFQFS